jgi:hypothetical protein
MEKIGRRVGRQAASTAMATSRNDHVAASTLSQLGSSVEAAIFRVRMRIMEITQGLGFAQSQMAVLKRVEKTATVRGTYKSPRPKTAESMIFCFRGI